MADQPHVLIIDDEREFLEIFGAKLSSAGFMVETALSGSEGIEKAKTTRPDLILLDMKMPGLTGAETLLALKDDPQTKDANVVFLTNLGDPRAEAQEFHDVRNRFSKELGAVGYLRKSDDLDYTTDRVKSFVSHASKDVVGAVGASSNSAAG